MYCLTFGKIDTEELIHCDLSAIANFMRLSQLSIEYLLVCQDAYLSTLEKKLTASGEQTRLCGEDVLEGYRPLGVREEVLLRLQAQQAKELKIIQSRLKDLIERTDAAANANHEGVLKEKIKTLKMTVRMLRAKCHRLESQAPEVKQPFSTMRATDTFTPTVATPPAVRPKTKPDTLVVEEVKSRPARQARLERTEDFQGEGLLQKSL